MRTFEREMASYLGRSEFVMVNSGSSANLILIEALMRPSSAEPRLRIGEKVIVPAIAWPTTVWPVVQLGLDAVFADVDLNTLALSRKTIEQIHVPDPAAVFAIHPLGKAISENDIVDHRPALNTPLMLSDVCESLGAWRSGRHAGSDSLASTFSFYFSHHITTMEGGGVAVDDAELAEDLRSIRAHGWSRGRKDEEKWTGNTHPTDAKFLFVTSGYNVRPMEIQAAIGLSQLEDLELFLARRREIAAKLHDATSELENIRMIGYDSDNIQSHSWMLAPFRVLDGALRSRREKVLDYLSSRGIETRPVLTGNMMSQPSVQRLLAGLRPAENFPVAQIVSSEMFLVGCHHDFDDDQVSLLANELRKADQQLSP